MPLFRSGSAFKSTSPLATPKPRAAAPRDAAVEHAWRPSAPSLLRRIGDFTRTRLTSLAERAALAIAVRTHSAATAICASVHRCLSASGGDLAEIGRASCRERVCQYV